MHRPGRPGPCMHARPWPARAVHARTALAGQGGACMHGLGRPGRRMHARPWPARAARACTALAGRG
eukprot:10221044-Lingulodinium_polyedra.AAC.1